MQKCRHPNCKCEGTPGDGYCSTICAAADRAAGNERGCRCGHPPCGDAQP